MYYAVFTDVKESEVKRVWLRPSLLGAFLSLQRGDHLRIYDVRNLTTSPIESLAYSTWIFDGKLIEIGPDAVETDFYFVPNL